MCIITEKLPCVICGKLTYDDPSRPDPICDDCLDFKKTEHIVLSKEYNAFLCENCGQTLDINKYCPMNLDEAISMMEDFKDKHENCKRKDNTMPQVSEKV